MKVLYIYRHPDMGFSIGKVFKPIEEEMRKYAEVDSVYLPCSNYQPKSLWENIRAARKAVNQKRYDIIHITGAEHYLIPFLPKDKLVVTVHDIMYYYYLSGLKKVLWKWLFIYPLKQACYITFISEFTMQQVLSVINLPKGRITVIPNPVSKGFVFKHKDFYESKPVVLHIGTLERKNLQHTIMALEGLRCHLRIVGTITKDIKERLKEHNLEYSSVENLSDEEIVKEYTDCDIVNFPSTFEGFGMPIIEGQATGRIVVTSDMSPMKDVAGGGAVLVNPYSIDSIRNAYKLIIKDGGMRKSLIENGLENVKQYKTSVIALKYLEIYNKNKL